MTERSARRKLNRLGWIAPAIAVVALLGASPAGAEPTPAVTVAPATGLVDGQSVAVTAAGFLAVSSSGGTFAATPTRKAECRHGGWRRLVDAHGMPFANQRRCIRFVRTGHST